MNFAWSYPFPAPLLAAVETASSADEFVPPPVEIWHWLLFGAFVAVLLFLDLFVFHKREDAHEPTLRESAMWTVIWSGLALAFNAFVWWWRGNEAGINFLTGYLIEWSLSMDNVFVFAVIFNHFKVPLMYQYRVLFYGILGAVIMRLTFVLVGTALISRFAWMMPLFGAFLIYTAIRLAFKGEDEHDPEHNIVMKLGRRLFRVTPTNHGDAFFVKEAGKNCVTPLFLVLLLIETTDVIFAVDSVPAIFGVTKDPFIVFTSNIFAILGLRALYFLLAGVMDMFRYLGYGLSAVLAFIGVKMIVDYLGQNQWGWGTAKHPYHMVEPHISLLIVLSLLAIAIVASIIAKRREDAAEVPIAESKEEPTS